MRPAPRLLWLVALVATIGLLSAVATAREWETEPHLISLLWLTTCVVVVAALIDSLASRRPPPISVARALPPYLALGVSQQVRLNVRNRGGDTHRLWIIDLPPANIEFSGLPAHLQLQPHQQVDIDYHVTPLQRGPATFDLPQCRVCSQWGLWERRVAFGAVETTKVYPNYKPLLQSSLSGDQLLGKWGVHLRQKRGEGTDFHHLRDFRIGDSLRQIDWRATARFHRPISREYQDERDQDVIFLLDCGRRMRAKDGALSHFDHTLNAMLLSAFVALKHGDAVGLLSFAGPQRWLAPHNGGQQLNRLLNRVYDLDSTQTSSDYLDVAQQIASRQNKRALVILLSSAEPQDSDDLLAATRMLNKHHLLLVACLQARVAADIHSRRIETFDQALAYCGEGIHRQNRDAMVARLRSDRIIVADTPPSRLHLELINAYMSIKRSGIF